MALTGILQRRNTRAYLDLNPPIEGEIVVSTDTGEYGWSDGQGGTVWKNLVYMQPILTVDAPPTGLENDEIGTVYLVVSAIVSVEITPINGYLDSNLTNPNSVQYLATATYGDGTTSDVTSNVLWSVNDTNISISTSGLATYEGVDLATGSALITGTLNGISTSVTITYGT